MKISKTLTRMAACITATLVFLWIGADKVKGADDEISFIDTHNHPPFVNDCDEYKPSRVQEVVLGTMTEFGIEKTLFMPPPLPPYLVSPCNGFEFLARMAREYPERFAFLRGGENLNPMIQQVVLGEMTLQEALPRFIRAANDILRDGAVGFGEMAAEHFSLHLGHPYISIPPDHFFFRLLADFAAGRDLAVELHMEALTRDTSLEEVCNISPAACGQGTVNPDVFRENITAFERLLRHNRHARIIWVHAGWDNTGQRTVDLMRGLLERHPNLYIQLRPLPRGAGRPNPILTDVPGEERTIGEEWQDFISDFPDRFIIGVDSFYTRNQPGETEGAFRAQLRRQMSAARRFVNLLAEVSPDLARKVAYQNAVRIYRLDEPIICHRPGTAAEQTMRIPGKDLNAHLVHGDTVGPCG